MSFLFFRNMRNFVAKVFLCLGLSSTDCNFQGLSRTFKVRASPVIPRSLASNPAWVKEQSENNQEKKPN